MNVAHQAVLEMSPVLPKIPLTWSNLNCKSKPSPGINDLSSRMENLSCDQQPILLHSAKGRELLADEEELMVQKSNMAMEHVVRSCKKQLSPNTTDLSVHIKSINFFI